MESLKERAHRLIEAKRFAVKVSVFRVRLRLSLKSSCRFLWSHLLDRPRSHLSLVTGSSGAHGDVLVRLECVGTGGASASALARTAPLIVVVIRSGAPRPVIHSRTSVGLRFVSNSAIAEDPGRRENDLHHHHHHQNYFSYSFE